MCGFCELHKHSTWSLLDGVGSAEAGAQRAAELGHPALAMTEHAVLSGVIHHIDACHEVGIMPIVGCLMRGQTIVTQTGAKQVEEIAIGDMVLTHRGRFRPVVRVMRKIYEGDVYEVSLAKNGGSIKLTEEHPILVRGVDGQTSWTKPGDIDTMQPKNAYAMPDKATRWQSWACLPKLQETNDDKLGLLMHIGDGIEFKSGRWTNGRRTWTFPSHLDVTVEMARFFGLFVGEGWTSSANDGGFGLTFARSEQHLVDEVVEYLRSLGLAPRVYDRLSRGSIDVRCCHRPLQSALSSICGRGAHGKRVPAFVYGSTGVIKEAFVSGVVDAECRKDFRSSLLRVASKDLAWGFRTLISDLGHWSKVKETKTIVDGKERIRYDVAYIPNRRHSMTLEDDDYLYRPIKSVVKSVETVEVFNFEVEEDNSYVSDFILHNCEMYYRENRTPFDKATNWEYFHMVAWAKDIDGWRSLKLLTSESYRSGLYRKPCVDDELLDKYSDGLILSTSCVSGFIPRAILRGDEEAVQRHAEKLTRWVGDDWVCEVQPHDFDDLRSVNLAMPGIAARYSRPLVATRDAHVPDPSWIETQHVSVKMRTKGSMISAPRKEGEADEKYEMTVADTAYISSREQTVEDFQRYHPHLDLSHVEQACDNTGWVADQVVPWLIDRSPKMPRYKATDEEDYRELRNLVFAGLRELGHDQDQRYVDAVEKELEIFRSKRFCAFFLWLGAMIKWLRSEDGLPPCERDKNPAPSKKPEKVGLGRGSAGGCVTAYALRITLINPINYDLSFERFLNPDRSGLPDIDIDLTEYGAWLAKEWLKRRKGDDRVYDMIAHATFGAREALRRVGMVYDVPHPELNAVSKTIAEDETSLPLDRLCEHIEGLGRFAERHPKVFEHAARLQGGNSKVTEHAAGVVFSEIPLDEQMPVMKKSAKDDYLVTAFGNSADKEIVSDLGFLKVDLLVVVALARQAYAEDLIRRVHGIDLDLDKLPALEHPDAADPKAMEIFCAGMKNGIFQWDGKSNMASLTKKIQPTSINHLSAANAGVRPGVSNHIGEYVRRHHGADFEYWDPSVEQALKETYGLPLYQEQIMLIFQLIGGYSAAEADTVRRIMAKYYRRKDGSASEMLGAYESQFTTNAASVCAGGRPVGEMIWAYCGNVSDYLFNSAHSKEYALIAHADAYLKAHYPDAFYASLLTFPPAWVKKPENRNEFYERNVREARALGIDILPPDVNDSDEDFTIRGRDVLFGFKGIKGLGPAMVADIINNRPFTSLEDMGARLTACNRAGRQHLGAAGALDRFGARDNLTEEERATHEENHIGVALSGADKLAGLREQLRPMLHTQDEVELASNGQSLVVGGEIISGREIPTRKGPSLKLTVAFGADEYKVSVPPWDYEEGTVEGDSLRELIASDAPIIVRGAKDATYDCVAADEIKSASEVLEMMATT